MPSSLRDNLPDQHPLQTERVRAAADAIYNWNYEPEIDQLRTLYANALDRQWIAMKDLDWDTPIDRAAFSRTFAVGGIPVTRTEFLENALPRHAVAGRPTDGGADALDFPPR